LAQAILAQALRISASFCPHTLPRRMAASVEREAGTRTVEGDTLAYDLYGQSTAKAGAIFLHGFGGGRAALAHHSQRAAALGAAVLAPDLSSLTRGGSLRELFVDRSVRSAQLRNVRQVVDHATWFDRKPFALIGHSAGGGIALEATVALQAAGRSPAVLVLLDAVPWNQTIELAGSFDLMATRLVSIRAEPSAWNKDGAVAEALRRVPSVADLGRLVDIQVVGARHGDPMVADWKLRVLRLLGDNSEVWPSLVDAFLADALGLNSGQNSADALVVSLRNSGVLRCLNAAGR